MVLERGNSDEIGVTQSVGVTNLIKFILEFEMSAILKEIEAQALQLPPKERGDLIHPAAAMIVYGPA